MKPFSFALPKTKPAAPLPPPKSAAVFSALDDDTLDAAPTASTDNKSVAVNKRLAVQTSTSISRTTRRKLEEEQKVDKSVFEYDEVYDRMKEAEERAKEKKNADAQERKVSSLFVISIRLADLICVWS